MSAWNPLALRLFIPIKLQSPQNLRQHWAQAHRRVRRQREATAAVVYMSHGKSPVFSQLRALAVKGAKLGFTFEGHVPRRLDDDGFVGACKASRDELCQLLGVIDSERAGHRFTYRPQVLEQTKIKQGLWVLVEVANHGVAAVADLETQRVGPPVAPAPGVPDRQRLPRGPVSPTKR